MHKLSDVKTTPQRRALLFILVLFLGLFSSVVWGVDYTVKTVPNVRLTDGNNHVTNPDGIISSADVDRINTLLTLLEKSTSIEVAVVAIHSIGRNDSHDFATDLFTHWGIGKKEDDNGLLIQLVTEPIQRSVVFKTGYGLEGILTDAVCYRLQQEYMIPDLKDGNYSSGMVKGVEAVVNYMMSSDYERKNFMDQSEVEETSSIPVGTIIELLIILLCLIFAVYKLIHTAINKNKCPQCAAKTFYHERTETLALATYTSTGLIKSVSRCRSCGHVAEKNTVTPMLRRVRTTRSYYSRGYSPGRSRSYSSGRSTSSSRSSSTRSSSSSRSSSSRSSSSRSSGRSYGGGRTGGGGARSKF